MQDSKFKLVAASGLILTLAALLPACTVIGDIFKAGAVMGIIVVVIIVAIIFWIMRMFRR